MHRMVSADPQAYVHYQQLSAGALQLLGFTWLSGGPELQLWSVYKLPNIKYSRQYGSVLDPPLLIYVNWG